MSQRLVVVSYRLPFQIVDNQLVQNSGGLVSAMLAYAQGDGSVGNTKEILWVGASNYSKTDLANALRTDDQKTFTLVPVKIPEEVDHGFYEGFCNNTIWPLFHYFPYLSKYKTDNWCHYLEANQLFTEEVLAHICKGDTLWIHDYHLMLMPRMIKKRNPYLPCGFFLHIPFPSYEVLRLLPRDWKNELLHGVLGADLVGFHTYDYVQHFCQSVVRAGIAQTQGSWLVNEEGSTRVEAFPIGIDAKKFSGALNSEETKTAAVKFREAIGSSKLVFSVDRLDYTKGLLQRLLAFEKFLIDYPEWIGKVAFNMVVVPSRDTIPQYQEMKSELETHVGRINGLYATLEWRPIVYQYKHLNWHEMIALYEVADVAMITPMRDGMNLVCKEFIACQPNECPGILILSEMAGAAAEMRESILINPNDLNEMTSALYRAATMGCEERIEIWERLRDRVFSYDVFDWANDFLQSLDQACHFNGKNVVVNHKAPEMDTIVASYLLSPRRLIFLDYDGTLVPFHRDPEKAIPSSIILDMLSKLSKDTRNVVAILSGRSSAFLDRWFSESPIHLIAEHGAIVRTAKNVWEQVWQGERGWKIPYLRIMRKATRKCPGATVEEKETAIVWHWRNADPIHGQRVAQELREDLELALQASDQFHLVEGHMILEIRPIGIDKGITMYKQFSPDATDFILALGDDRTDEDMFAMLPHGSFTVKVGKGSSKARYSVPEPTDVLQLLDRLTRIEDLN